MFWARNCLGRRIGGATESRQYKFKVCPRDSREVGSLLRRGGGRNELQDAVAVRIHDVYASLIIHGNVQRLQKVSGLNSRDSPLRQECPVLVELLDALIAAVRHVDIANRIHGDPAGSTN